MQAYIYIYIYTKLCLSLIMQESKTFLMLFFKAHILYSGNFSFSDLIVCNFLFFLFHFSLFPTTPPSPSLYVTHVYSQEEEVLFFNLFSAQNYYLKWRRGTSLVSDVLRSITRKYECSYFLGLLFCVLFLAFKVLSHFILPQLLICSARGGMQLVQCRNFQLRAGSKLCCLMWQKATSLF